MPRSNGRHTVDAKGHRSPKGTITLLREWITVSVRLSEDTLTDELVGEFRKVRNHRSKPSHTVRVDEWDDKYVAEQRDLMREVMGAFECLQSILGTHPDAGQVKPPGSLLGEILYC